MAKNVPPIAQRIPNLPEREPYDALDLKQALYEKRLNERLQEIAAEYEKQKDVNPSRIGMKHIPDPAKVSRDQYGRLSQAGD